MRLALDTNTYRAFMDGQTRAVALVREAEFIGLPVPVIAELRVGFLGGTRGRLNEAALGRFLDSPRVHVLPCDEQTSHFYAPLIGQLKRHGTPIPINDVWIAALTLQHQCLLYTLDSDFDRLAQLPRAWP